MLTDASHPRAQLARPDKRALLQSWGDAMNLSAARALSLLAVTVVVLYGVGCPKTGTQIGGSDGGSALVDSGKASAGSAHDGGHPTQPSSDGSVGNADAGSATSSDAGSHALDASTSGTHDAGSDAGPAPVCSGAQHACACATGYYCLFAGAECIAPTSSCPASGIHCKQGEHSCACATGAYCLFAGAECIAPTSPCP
jgi:hypothetical protein